MTLLLTSRALTTFKIKIKCKIQLFFHQTSRFCKRNSRAQKYNASVLNSNSIHRIDSRKRVTYGNGSSVNCSSLFYLVYARQLLRNTIHTILYSMSKQCAVQGCRIRRTKQWGSMRFQTQSHLWCGLKAFVGLKPETKLFFFHLKLVSQLSRKEEKNGDEQKQHCTVTMHSSVFFSFASCRL